MYILVYASMHRFMYVFVADLYMGLCIDASVYVCMYPFMHLCMGLYYVCTYRFMYVYIGLCMYDRFIHLCIGIYTYVSVYVCVIDLYIYV